MNKGVHFKGPIVAIGVFDGVHRGHSAILRAAVRDARTRRTRSVVITFWPHPQKEQTLYSLAHRLRLIKEAGVDEVRVVRFSARFSKVGAERFIARSIVGRLHPVAIYVGGNFRFGAGAQGDILLLRRLGGRYHFRVRSFPILMSGGLPVSSTRIRALIGKGELARAAGMLGRSVSVLGTVVRGERRGRTLGFPTANIDPHHEVIPPQGIYAVWAVRGARKLAGACYIGTRPTFFRGKKAPVSIEVHLFDFRADLYRRQLEVQFVRRLRADRAFATPQALAGQIGRDLAAAKKLLL